MALAGAFMALPGTIMLLKHPSTLLHQNIVTQPDESASLKDVSTVSQHSPLPRLPSLPLSSLPPYQLRYRYFVSDIQSTQGLKTSFSTT